MQSDLACPIYRPTIAYRLDAFQTYICQFENLFYLVLAYLILYCLISEPNQLITIRIVDTMFGVPGLRSLSYLVLYSWASGGVREHLPPGFHA